MVGTVAHPWYIWKPSIPSADQHYQEQINSDVEALMSEKSHF